MLNRRYLKICALGFIAMSAAMLSVTRSADATEATCTAGLPITASYSQTIVTIGFLGSDVAHTGQLVFLEPGSDSLTVNTFASNSDTTDLSTFLVNHQSSIGDTTTLPGVFSGGNHLHFTYDIIAPSHAANELYRTDNEIDPIQFMFNPDSGFLGIEDLLLPFRDEDDNDAQFGLSYSAIPGPGILVAMSVMLGMSCLNRTSPA